MIALALGLMVGLGYGAFGLQWSPEEFMQTAFAGCAVVLGMCWALR